MAACADLAIHCLGVVEPSEAWLDCGSPWLTAHSLLATSAPGLHPHQLFKTAAVAGGGSGGGGGARPRCVTVAQLARDVAVLRAVAVLHASGLVAGAAHRQRPPARSVALRSRHRCIEKEGTCTSVSPRHTRRRWRCVAGMDPLHPQLDAGEVLGHLLLGGRYEDALALAREGWPAGSPASLAALEQVVGALAEAAAHMQLTGAFQALACPASPSRQRTGSWRASGSGAATRRGGALPACAGGSAQLQPGELPTPLHLLSCDPHQQQALLGCSHLASPAAPLWSKLRALLLDASSAPAGALGALRVAAADAVLRLDRNLVLPVWLSQLFTVR